VLFNAPGLEAKSDATLKKVVALWNDMLGKKGFPVVHKPTPARERHFTARLNEDKRRHSLAWWGDQFEFMAQSDFLLAKAKEGAQWLTFDWILNENNLVKVEERKYKNDLPESRSSPDEPKPQTYEEAKALEALKKQRESPGPRTYEEAKALERGIVIDADFRVIGGDSP
jgi:hypothetical protein